MSRNGRGILHNHVCNVGVKVPSYNTVGVSKTRLAALVQRGLDLRGILNAYA